MSKYLKTNDLNTMILSKDAIFSEREKIYKLTGIDILDTDALSSLSLYEIIVQYDKNINVNFARNGEDGKSNNIVFEMKTTRIPDDYTKTGKLRKNAGKDASFQFHANGDLVSPRYILAARRKDNLEIVRIYDISDKENCKIIQNYLENERQKWRDRGANQKRDVIVLPEVLLLTLPILKTLTIKNVIITIA